MASDCSDCSDYEEPSEPPTIQVSGGQTFPPKVSGILEMLYQRGMTGWGKKHSAEVRFAMTSTGLKLSQIKVRV